MVDNITLPVVVENRLLISAGTWNGNEYSAKEIGEGFARTNWTDKDKISLWLNHDDKNTAAFVGYVKNPTLASEGRVFGDLEIWDEKTAILLTKAMAKFGVSAKIKGTEDKKGKMNSFTFENFSIVTVPACSEAYINLAKQEKTSKYLISDKDIDDMLGEEVGDETELARGEGQGVGGGKQGDGGTAYCYCPKCNYKVEHDRGISCNEKKCPKCGSSLTGESPKEMAEVTDMETERKKRGMTPAQFYAVPRDPPSSSSLPIFDKVHTQNAMSRFNQTKLSPEEKASAKRKIISAANKFGIIISDKFKSLFNIDERGLKIDIMAEEEEKKEEVVEEKVEEVAEVEEELSEKDMLKTLSEKFDKLISLLSKKLEEEEVVEEKVEEPVEEVVEEPVEEVEKENKELTAVKKELAEIKEKLNSPKSKTVRNLSSNSVGDAKYDANVFCDMLETLDKPMKFI